MKTHLFRMLSLCLALCLVFGISAAVAPAAFAAEGNNVIVDEAGINGVTEPAAGAAPTVEGITTGEYATVKFAEWQVYNYESNTWQALSGNFADGNIYRIHTLLSPAEGYEFDWGVRYYVNGEGPIQYAYYNSDGDLEIDFSYPVGLTYVASYEADFLPADIQPGQDSAELLAQIIQEEGAPCRLFNYEWRVLDPETSTNSSFSGAFETGKTYYLEFDIVPNPGYYMDDNFEIFANGESIHQDFERTTQSGWGEVYLTTCELITEASVTVTGFEKDAPVSDITVTIPEGASYGLEDINLYDSNFDSFEGETLADGNLYYLEINLAANNGYLFPEDDDDLQVTVTGAELEVYNSYEYETKAHIFVVLDLTEKIDSIELPAWPAAPAAGDVPDAPLPVTPEDAHYMYIGAWIDAENGEDVTVFEEGKLYYYVYIVMPDEGFSLADDAVVTVGGESTFPTILSDSELIFIKDYPLGIPIVEKVEITAADFADGKPVTTPTLPADADYALVDDGTFWAVSPTGNLSDIELLDAGETFEKGNYYFLELALTAEEGKVISSQTKFLFNGKEATVAAVMDMNGMTLVILSLGKMPAPATNPATGDFVPVAALALLAAASTLGMGVMLSHRKRI